MVRFSRAVNTAQVQRFIPNAPRPRTFTAGEQVVEYLAEKIITDKITYTKIAHGVGVSQSTIGNIASRKTRWPRPHTLFALLAYYRVKFQLTEDPE